MEHADTVDVPVSDELLSLEERLARARAAGDPWAKMAGIFKDDPLFDEWVEIMRENRRSEEGDVMQIPVLVEPLSADRFRATGGAPLTLSAEGATRDEALARLSSLVRESLNGGAEIVTLSVPAEDPSARFAGMFRDNPLFDEWQEAIYDYRAQRDAEDGG